MAENVRSAYGGLEWVEAHRKQLGASSARGIYVLRGSRNIYWNNAGRIAEIVSATLGD